MVWGIQDMTYGDVFPPEVLNSDALMKKRKALETQAATHRFLYVLNQLCLIIYVCCIILDSEGEDLKLERTFLQPQTYKENINKRNGIDEQHNKLQIEIITKKTKQKKQHK